MRAAGLRWTAGFLLVAGIGVAADHWIRETLETDLAARSRAVIAADPLAADDWVRLSVQGRDIILQGHAPSAEHIARAIDSLQAVAGAGRLINQATLSSGPAAGLTMTWADGTLSISGGLPQDGSRASLREAAARTFPQAKIAENFSGGGDAVPDLDGAVGVGLQLLAALPTGSLTLKDRTLRLSGDMPERMSPTVLRDARNALPPGFVLDASGLKPPRVAEFYWAAHKQGRDVVLEGFVPDAELHPLLLTQAQRIMPDAVLVDRMQVGAGAESSLDFAEAARFALRKLTFLQTGAVEIRGSALKVSGQTSDRTGELELTASLGVSLPGGLTGSQASVTAAPVEPYVLRARREAGRLVLSGHFPDAQSQATLHKLIQRRFVMDEVVDETRLGDGAPRSFVASAVVGIERLAQLANGELVLEGRTIGITGESLYAQAAAQFGSKLSAEAPPEWSVTARVRGQGSSDQLDPQSCQQQVSDTVGQAKIGFEEEGAAFTPAAELLLDRLGRVLSRCPEAPVAVQVLVSEDKSKSEVIQERLEALKRRLVAGGIDEARLIRATAAMRQVEERADTTGATGAAIRLEVRL